MSKSSRALGNIAKLTGDEEPCDLCVVEAGESVTQRPLASS
jgi:hypothetical protein